MYDDVVRIFIVPVGGVAAGDCHLGGTRRATGTRLSLWPALGSRRQLDRRSSCRSVAIDGAQLLTGPEDSLGRRHGGATGGNRRWRPCARVCGRALQGVGHSAVRRSPTRAEFPLGRQGREAPGLGVNVIGRIDRRRQPARHIVVSAHYDHVGVQSAGGCSTAPTTTPRARPRSLPLASTSARTSRSTR